MKERIKYGRNYPEGFLDDYNRLLRYIKKNFLEDTKLLNPKITGGSKIEDTKYIGIDKNVLIRISLNFSRKKGVSNYYESNIIVEKVGDKIEKISKIEQYLLNECFKKNF